MRLAGLLLFLLGSSVAGRAEVGLPPGRGVLLPVQDRVGAPRLVQLGEALLRRELEAHTDLAAAGSVRAVLRGLRIRDASDEPPDRLAALAESLEAEWFFLATLHEARRGREAQREDAGPGRSPFSEGGRETPQVVVSARVVRKGSPELWWAGFEAATGRDRERILGLGEVGDVDELLQAVVRDLVAEVAAAPPARRRARLRHRQGGYLRAAKAPSPPARVAVVPFDSVAELEPGLSADLATAALFATLDDFGFKTMLPGLVRIIRQESGRPQRGGASRSEWEALGRKGGADWVATGTVETYRRGLGRNPLPWVAFSVRFVATDDGKICWVDGLERTGLATASAFDRGRIYSSGNLTYEMMRSLFDRMRPNSATARTHQ